jgi:hypothetical protein
MGMSLAWAALVGAGEGFAYGLAVCASAAEIVLRQRIERKPIFVRVVMIVCRFFVELLDVFFVSPAHSLGWFIYAFARYRIRISVATKSAGL